MGQYYKPIILNKEKTRPVFFGDSHSYGSGLKLMEHSWIGNTFVGSIEKALINNPMPIVWAGDYADNEENISPDILSKLLKDTDKEYREGVKKDGANLYTIADSVGTQLTHGEEFKSYDEKYNFKFDQLPERFKYIVNHDKGLFVNKDNVPSKEYGEWEMSIHPLPLLTCEGNNRGGGDYRGEDEIIGSWARDVISIESRKSDIPKGFTELAFNLVE